MSEGHMNTDMHDNWLALEAQMMKRHRELWPLLAQGMQSAYYFGALAALQSKQTKPELWRQCETGLQDALKMPGMRIVETQKPKRSDDAQR